MKKEKRKQANGASHPPKRADLRTQIEIRAYELWQASNRCQGRDLDHWLQAERELATFGLGQ